RIIEVENAMKFTNDNHNQLDIFCNDMLYRQKGILTTSTDLKTQGSSATGAQNRFIKTASGAVKDYLDISGSTPNYYYVQSQVTAFTQPYISNIPVYMASADRTCLLVMPEDCRSTVGITEHPNKPNPQMLIFPNPNSGTFTINFSNLTRGIWTLNVYDMLGKLI